MKKTPALVVVAMAAACALPTDLCGCPPTLGIGTVAGVVARADGAPVAGAVIRVEARIHGCALSTPSDLVDPGLAVADPAGSYRYALRTYAPSDSACVRITARAPGEPAEDSVTVDGLRMRLIPSYGSKQRPESLRVDFRLP